MTHRCRYGLDIVMVLLVGGGSAAAEQLIPQAKPGKRGIWRETSFTAIASGEWNGSRLPDGQPDVQGHWSNTIANHNNWTDPHGGVPGDPNQGNIATGPRDQRAPSRVSDPSDGQVPFQAWSRAAQESLLANFHNPTRVEHIEPLARCAPGGVLKSFTWHGYEIRQYPGYVLFLFNTGTRIVHVDAKRPHLPAQIKLWNGDSRGHWDGNTLVVDVTNNNGKARLARTGEFFSENAHIVERFTFDSSGERYNYVATVTDPTVFTRPWTATIPAQRWSERDEPNGWDYEVNIAHARGRSLLHESYERICVENNGAFGGLAPPNTGNGTP